MPSPPAPRRPPPELPRARRCLRRPRAGRRPPFPTPFSPSPLISPVLPLRAHVGRPASRTPAPAGSHGCADPSRCAPRRHARSEHKVTPHTQGPQRAWQADGEHVGVIQVPGDRVGGQGALAHVVPQQVRRVELALRAPRRRGGVSRALTMRRRICTGHRAPARVPGAMARAPAVQATCGSQCGTAQLDGRLKSSSRPWAAPCTGSGGGGAARQSPRARRRCAQRPPRSRSGG